MFVGAVSLCFFLSLSLFLYFFVLSLFEPLSFPPLLSLYLSCSLSLFPPLSLSASLFSSFPPSLSFSFSVLLSFFISLTLCRCFSVSHTHIVTHNLTYSRMCVCACVRILKKTSCDWRVTSKMPGFIWRAVRSKCARSLTSRVSLSIYTRTLYTYTRRHTGTGSLHPVCLTNTYTGDLGEIRAQGASLHTYLNTLSEMRKKNLPSLCLSLAHTHMGDITGELGERRAQGALLHMVSDHSLLCATQ